MFLKRLKLTNFKNFGQFDAELSPKVNCFVGNNGVGKTNVLDAVYHLSFAKSYFQLSQNQQIKRGESFLIVEGVYHRDGETENVVFSISEAGRRLKRNGKQVERLADYIGIYPLVIVSPYDSDLISDGSKQRRKFTDGVISQTDRQHLATLVRYQKTLEQRNAFLKIPETNPVQLDVYDKLIFELGNELYKKRSVFLKEFIPYFKNAYKEISGSAEEADIIYNSVFTEENAAELQREARRKDIIAGYSTFGAHKDDLHFTIDGFSVRKYGSQGQQKSFLTALKFAQFRFMKKYSPNDKPLLLLDDIFDKLDARRVEYILKLVNSDIFGQIFITDTHKSRIEDLLKGVSVESKIFEL